MSFISLTSIEHFLSLDFTRTFEHLSNHDILRYQKEDSKALNRALEQGLYSFNFLFPNLSYQAQSPALYSVGKVAKCRVQLQTHKTANALMCPWIGCG